jgi:hypothetical protein
MNVYDAIEAKYGFPIPAAYRRIEAEGAFKLRHPGQFFDPANEATYLWIPEAEWLKHEEILAYKPYPEALPGFTPIAQTGAGDRWCWWPMENAEVVVQCPHDSSFGRFDAPNLISLLYRRCLEFAANDIESEQEDWVRRNFVNWAERLKHYLPQEWIDELRSLAQAPLVDWNIGKLAIKVLMTPSDCAGRIRLGLGFGRLDEEFLWCRE